MLPQNLNRRLHERMRRIYSTSRRFGVRCIAKIGTMAAGAVWMRPVDSSSEISDGARVEVRYGRGYGDKWQGPIIVDEIRETGPPSISPEGLIVFAHWS